VNSSPNKGKKRKRTADYSCYHLCPNSTQIHKSQVAFAYEIDLINIPKGRDVVFACDPTFFSPSEDDEDEHRCIQHLFWLKTCPFTLFNNMSFLS